MNQSTILSECLEMPAVLRPALRIMLPSVEVIVSGFSILRRITRCICR